MLEPGSFNLSITLLIIGLIFSFGAYLLLRVMPKANSDRISTTQEVALSVSNNEDAVIIIESGGRVTFINKIAREWFKIADKEPNLERLAKLSRPEDSFLSLCAKPGKARFLLNNRFVEGISHSIPYNGRKAIVLTIRPDQSTSPVSREANESNQILGIISSLNRSISNNHTIKNSVKSILHSVEPLTPADSVILSLWNSETTLITSYQYQGLVGKDRELVISNKYGFSKQDIQSDIIKDKKSLLIQDINTHPDRRSKTVHANYPYKSYLGIPLLLADELIGILEFVSLSEGVFTGMDIDILEKLSEYIAIVVHNAILFQDEQQRVIELSSLATLSRAVNSIHDTSDFYAKLTQAITPLLDVEIAGFLIYNKTQRRIVGQWPFHGLPANFIPYYQVDIPPDSPAEEIWLSTEPIVSNAPQKDQRIIDLGFDHAARAAGIHTTTLIPLISSGRKIGYLQTANKRDGSHFNQEDIRLLEIIAGQSAPIIENAELVKQSVKRALRSEGMQRITSLTTSDVNLDEIFKYCIQELARLIQADSAAFYIFESEGRELTLHKDSFFGMEQDINPDIKRLEVKNSHHHLLVSQGKTAFMTGNVLEDLQQLSIYRPFLEFLEGKSALVVPVRLQNRGYGEICLVSNQSETFNHNDLLLAKTVAGQIALAIEHNLIVEQTDNKFSNTTDHLKTITSIRELNSTYSLDQLQALTELPTSISSGLHSNVLIQSLLEQLEKLLPFNTGTLWLREGDELVIKATRGFDPTESMIGLTTRREDSVLFDEMIRTGSPLLIGDMSSDYRFPRLDQRLYNTWLGVPILSKDDVIGVIALEHEKLDFYTDKEVQIATIFAGQVAIALENARLFQHSKDRTKELSQRSNRLDKLFQFSKIITNQLNPEVIINLTLKELIESTGASRVSALLWNDNLNTNDPLESITVKIEVPSIDTDFPDTMQVPPLFNHLRKSLGIFVTDNVYKDENIATLKEFFEIRGTLSLICLPLTTGEKAFGFLLLHSNQENKFTPNEVDISRIITNQASAAIQNAQLFVETYRLKNSLEKRVEERTEQLGKEHQRAQTLLQITNELSSSLDLDQILSRTMILINKTVDAEQSTIMLIKPDENTFYYQASQGINPDHFSEFDHLEINPLDRDIASWVIKNQEGLLISNVSEDKRWLDIVSENTQQRSVLAVPLQVREEILGAFLLFHPKTGKFNENDMDLVRGAATQIAVAINNAELFNLIRDQAEDLGNMLRNQQVEASRSRAILEAVADGVLVTNSDGEITLFNHSAQQILDLDGSQLIGKSLDQFKGLFGNAAVSWIETIQRWSNDPESYQTGDTYEEQITLDQGQVVAVHLAPVSLEDEFFGTVSIFRDISHLIELDRLKSEFVARVSHELRTPMTSIKGYIDLLLMGAAGDLNQQQDDFLEIVKSNTERLHVLVNDLLDVSRIETGRMILSIQALNLRELTDEVTMSLRKRSQEDGKPMNITRDIPSDIPRVYGDRDCVHKIFANLLSNAYNYTLPGGSITIRAQEKGEHVQIDIQDNGIGIPPDEQQQVFERFYRGEDPLVLSTSGTGLGLAIVQQLVEKQKGEIWLGSSGHPGEGSTFSFTLPTDEPQSN